MQTSAKKACFQFAECSFSYAKLRLFLVTSKVLGKKYLKVGRTLLIWLKTHRIGDSPPIRESSIFSFSSSLSSIFSLKPWKLRGKVVSLHRISTTFIFYDYENRWQSINISRLDTCQRLEKGEVIEVENNPFVGIVISEKPQMERSEEHTSELQSP